MKISRHFIVLILALLFSWLFFKRSTGLNLLIFDSIALSVLYFLDREKFQHTTVRILFMGTLIAATCVTWHNTAWSIFAHHMSFGLLGGVLAGPRLKNLVNIAFAGILNIILSVQSYFNTRKTTPLHAQPKTLKRVWYAVRVGFIPVIVVAIFGTLYAKSSPWFNTFWLKFNALLRSLFGDLFEMFSFTWLFTFVFGAYLTIYLFFATDNDRVADAEMQQPDDLTRKRKRYRGSILALKRELHIAILLFATLNLLLLGQNILDIIHVWFGFSWNGDYLKQFVHEGTYLLIFSIIISAGLVIFYFRNNLNHYKNNRLLRWLASLWLAQNVVLAASVAVRNMHYINYFNLAYKRIGIFFFLIAVIYGLYTVYRKVNRKKTINYLIRTNAMSIYIIILSIGLFNWDTIIARYNFKHAQEAYIHLNFLSKLSASALPYLEHDIAFLETVRYEQDETYGRDVYAITPETYVGRIETKKTNFLTVYARRHWLEWNYDDWRAYKKLTSAAN
jgi:hypothetical protein